MFEDPRERDRGYNEPRYSGSGPGGGPGAYGERGGYRGRGRPDYGMRGRYINNCLSIQLFIYVRSRVQKHTLTIIYF